MAEVVAESAILVAVSRKRPRTRVPPQPGRLEDGGEESLAELAALAATAGARIAGSLQQSLTSPDPATLIGAGKLEELRALADALRADLVLFDNDLTPTQLRNLEKRLPARVVDRTQLILDIFARRARTSEGQLQVELAQLNYLLPRLTGRGVQMSRLGGGIGTRGPGETQLESDRRKIARRIRKIREQLESVRAARAVQRRQRQAVPLATLALVGYTNAGKSTLFNRLTGAGVVADARLFATLDPTVRQAQLPSRRRVLLSDTVGFIRNLPHTLVEAFRATLEEVTESTLLLHVVDVSSPRAAEQTANVLQMLAEIGVGGRTQLLVLNQIDRLGEPRPNTELLARRILAANSEDSPAAVAVSARTGEGLDRLLEAIDGLLPLDPVAAVRFRFPLSEGAKTHLLHQFGRVLNEHYLEDSCLVEAEVPESLRKRLRSYEVRERSNRSLRSRLGSEPQRTPKPSRDR